jgi:hypothetical protein
MQLDTKVMQKRPDECKTNLEGQAMHLQRLKSKLLQYLVITKQLLVGSIISIMQVVQTPFV